MIKKKIKWYMEYHQYVCLNCNNAVLRRATSGHNGVARKCPLCQSTNILRDDHPFLNMKGDNSV